MAYCRLPVLMMRSAAAARWCTDAAISAVGRRSLSTSTKCRPLSRLPLLWMVGGGLRAPSLRSDSVRSFVSGRRSTPLSTKSVVTEEEEEESDSNLEDDDDDVDELEDDDLDGDLTSDLEGEDEGFEGSEDDFASDGEEAQAGDGADGGGIVLGGTSWGAKALEIVQRMLPSDGDLALYAFKASKIGTVQVRLDKLTNKFGSPTLEEVRSLNSSYGALLEEAGQAGLVPANISLEVSSAGAERVLQIPRDLSRFKELPMQVCYMESEVESQGIFQLDSLDEESQTSVWRLANVGLNREGLGKGRSFNKKQREWRLQLPLSSLKLVRLHVDV